MKLQFIQLNYIIMLCLRKLLLKIQYVLIFVHLIELEVSLTVTYTMSKRLPTLSKFSIINLLILKMCD